jgi:hypothetical protein
VSTGRMLDFYNNQKKAVMTQMIPDESMVVNNPYLLTPMNINYNGMSSNDAT